MAKARFFHSDLDQTALWNHGGFLPEMWQIIFAGLEPTFLNSVLRTCKLFNVIAGSNAIFNLLLGNFYQLALPEATEGASYDAFEQRYSKDCQTLSYQARKLLGLCMCLDFSQIELFQLDPDMLFEEDSNQDTLLLYINRLQNQVLRDLLFRKIHEWFLAKARAGSWVGSLSFLWQPDYGKVTFQLKTLKNYFLVDFAVALNQFGFIQKHVTEFVEPISSSKKPITFLESACLFGHRAILEFFLARNSAQVDYQALLYHALKGNQTEMVKFLFVPDRVAVIDRRLMGRIDISVNDRRLAVLELVLDKIKKDNPQLLPMLLREACSSAQPEAGKLIVNRFPQLLDAPITIYMADAAFGGCVPLMQLFLSRTENISKYIKNHLMLFVLVVMSGRTDAANYLLDLGAPIDACNGYNETALHRACAANDFVMVQLLHTRGANLTLRSHKQQTALDIARANQNEEITHYLEDALGIRNTRKRKADSMDPIESEIKQPDFKRARH